MLSQAEPFFLIFQKSDAQNVISLLNVMVGCVVNKILKIFTLELDWQESMMNFQDVNFVVAFKSNLSLMMIKATIVYIFSTYNPEHFNKSMKIPTSNF